MTILDQHCEHNHHEPSRAWALLPLTLVLKAIVWTWRLAGSPIVGPICRYQPSCSHYALDAIDRFGPLRGGWLTLKRLTRCHPWGGSGYDPVPAQDSDSPLSHSRL